MNISEKKISYVDESRIFTIDVSFDNGIVVKMGVHLLADKFIDYQKDLLEDFIADFQEKLDVDIYEIDDVKQTFEAGLQSLNAKLKTFADKVSNIDYFPIKGYIQLFVDSVLMASMIGDVSIMIFRDGKLYYSLHNGTDKKGSIDLFSDFVEGDIESGDDILYVGTKISDVLDDQDIKELQSATVADDNTLAVMLEELLNTRIDKDHVSFVHQFVLSHLATGGLLGGPKKALKKNGKKFRMPAGFSMGMGKVGKNLMANKYYVTVIILSIIVLFMLYHVLSQLLYTTENDVLMTEEGVLVDVTIDDIKQDIQLFQSMDPTSDAKAQKYHEIMQKLDLLEEKGRWIEDVAQLRKIIQADYHKGFNIIYITDLAQFDDPTTESTTNIFNFNTAESSALGSLHSIIVTDSMLLAGTQGAIIGALNDGIRGTLVDYGEDEPATDCGLNLLRNGLYCYTPSSRIFNVTKVGIETATTATPTGFPDGIDGVSVYGKANMYVFHPTLYGTGVGGTFVTRYRNTLGSQTQYQEGQDYTIPSQLLSGLNFSQGFSDYVIDGNFLARSQTDRKLYQLWREGVSLTLQIRAVPLLGGDNMSDAYSEDVKVISHVNSRYVYLFDSINQSITVYESRPLKTNDEFTKSYNLHYLFRFTFDLEGQTIIDVAVPAESGDRPELYILTPDGVNKVKLYEFIDSVKENNVLKEVNIGAGN